MKKILFFTLLLFPFILFSQDTIQEIDTFRILDTFLIVPKLTVLKEATQENMVNLMTGIYTLIMIIWGYISRWFNIKFPSINFYLYVIAGGIVIGGVLIYSTNANKIGLIAGFLSAIGFYNVLLKHIEKLIKKV